MMKNVYVHAKITSPKPGIHAGGYLRHIGAVDGTSRKVRIMKPRVDDDEGRRVYQTYICPTSEMPGADVTAEIKLAFHGSAFLAAARIIAMHFLGDL